MKPPTFPRTVEEWERYAGGVLRAHLKLAGLNYPDLKQLLAGMGLEQTTSNIAGKLNHGRFSAVFFLQVLVAVGVKRLDLPAPLDEN